MVHIIYLRAVTHIRKTMHKDGNQPRNNANIFDLKIKFHNKSDHSYI